MLALLERIALGVEHRHAHIEAVDRDEPRPSLGQVLPGDDVGVLGHPVARQATVARDGVCQRPLTSPPLDGGHSDFVRCASQGEAALRDAHQRLRLGAQDEVVVVS